VHVTDPLVTELSAIFVSFLQGGGEESLLRGYEIGRRTVEADQSLLKLVECCHETFAQGLRRASSVQQVSEIARSAGELLSASLAPFEMTHRGYKESVRGLVEANRQLEAFSYSVAHDLRSPLSVIIGFNDLVIEQFGSALGEDGRAMVAGIRRSAERMEQIIKGLLDLSRLGRKEISPEQVDLSKMANEIIAEHRETDAGRAVSVSIQGGMIAEADYQLMWSLMTNLISNAWKYTSKRKEAEIEIGTEEVNGERAYFVRDNGAGFDMQQAGKLFSPFQRMHGMDEFEGIGIGLSTARRITERLGGRIWTHAELDQGATFFFTLGRISRP
jgi:light-regulated signal transduction histidine kinase (bacteriophytochrome)